ncbi:MAG: glycosyltransferase family 87 protein [Planctomycetota bacterium]
MLADYRGTDQEHHPRGQANDGHPTMGLPLAELASTMRVERWATTRRGKTLAGLACVAIIVFLGGKAHIAVREAGAEHSNDYECFVSAARAVLGQEDVIEARRASGGRPYMGLPWFAMAMVPFALLGYSASSFLWPAVNLIALGASSYWCLRVSRGAEAPIPWPACVVPPLLAARALDSNFALGQLNVVLLALVAAGLYLYVRRRPVAAGPALGAAMMLKVTAGLLVAYFAWKRQWRLVAGATVAALVLALVAPIPVYGVRGGWDSSVRWLDTHVFSKVRGRRNDGYVPGQSLRAITCRLLTDSQAAAHTETQVRVNLASLPARAAEAAYRAVAIVLVALLALATRGPANPEDATRNGTELSLVMLAMLLISPYSRKAHFVLLMLPMAFAYSRLALAESWSRRERVLLAGFVVSLLLTACTAPGLIGTYLSVRLTALACMGWGSLVLLLALLGYLLLSSPRRGPAGGEGETGCPGQACGQGTQRGGAAGVVREGRLS